MGNIFSGSCSQKEPRYAAFQKIFFAISNFFQNKRKGSYIDWSKWILSNAAEWERGSVGGRCPERGGGGGGGGGGGAAEKKYRKIAKKGRK